MVRRIYEDQHRVCIYEEPTEGRAYPPNALPGAITNPLANLGQIYFHSDLQYVVTAYDESRTITLPARTYPPGNAKHDFPNHNLGFIPDGVLRIGNTQIPTGEPIQGTSSAARHVAVVIDNQRVSLLEAWNYSSLSPITLTFRVILFRPAQVAPAEKMYFESAARIVMGQGKFSTDNDYIKHAPASPDFFMTRGRTIDTQNARLRSVRPNGDVRNFNGYSGSFSGEGFFGVGD